MGNVLYLVHRIPFPPNKGDKVRSYHLLKHLAAQHRVFLGTFIDDPEDAVHVERVRTMCADLHVAELSPRLAKLRSLKGLWTNQALSLGYYSDKRLRSWVDQILLEQKIDAIVIFSSVMAQYIDCLSKPGGPTVLVDFVDVDSAKWTQYADNHKWPMSWVYKREGLRLLDFERAVAASAKRSFFVTNNEAELFRQLAPNSSDRLEVISNGVDADFFSTDLSFASPFGTNITHESHLSVVFTGAMDYWPNIDAVNWFVASILPELRRRWPSLCFYIVGRNPPATVLTLACDFVVVTGTVTDVRPYLQYASVVVAPLRIARGIQNKVLEAMSMSRPVVASRSCVDAIDARSEEGLIPADTATDFVREISALLQDPDRAAEMGRLGRERVMATYSWQAHLGRMDRHLANDKESMNEHVDEPV